MRVLLSGDPHLLRDEIVHRHLPAEGSCRGERGGGAEDPPGALAVVGEEDDGAVGEVEGGERCVGVGHVGEAEEIFVGFGEEEVLVCGEGLVLDWDAEVVLDYGFELRDCDVWVVDGDSF